MKKYIPSQIEEKWQEKWEEDGLYKADNFSSKPKKYILDMFPYPSGDGLHVGHFKGYVATDIVSRFYRFQGFNVLHPMGWDAFGLPAENYALKTGIHPSISIAQNIANIKRQMQMAGLSYDWEREIDTTNPDYYKWTQWIFIKLFEQGLAYEDEAPINWCPSCKTGLANEEVLASECERCGTQVEQRKIRQWILRITKYADKLVEGLENLDWPQPIKDMQVNWIGRSEGTLIKFQAQNFDKSLEVFTTRPDTLFGATFLVISPEYLLLKELTSPAQKAEVENYIEEVAKKTELERKESKEKTGVFTGAYVKHPLSGEDIPVWVADYVLASYGTGAIMAVPAHDQRDFEFAKKYGLEIRRVIAPIARGPVASVSQVRPRSDETSDFAVDARDLSSAPPLADSALTCAYEGDGVLINSGEFNGLSSNRAKASITNYLEQHQLGKKLVQYHLRDWVFSRQRYWGEPIPLLHCQKCEVVAVPEEELPLKLPEVEKYQPTGTGESPLAALEEWVNTTCPKCGGPAKRETNTMPQWAGSCWYYLRFCDPQNKTSLVSKAVEKYWMPVDWYVGGAEHAVLHLLYARFWHKFLYDIGVISTSEPFQKLTNVGLVLAPDGRKMSKRWGNVVTPDEIVKEYGADTLRVYESFMGPFGNTINWDPSSIYGVFRFLNRVWEVALNPSREDIDESTERALNKLIKKVEEDIAQMKFNTAVASMMEFINLVFHKGMTDNQKKRFLIILAPFAPHITEELWEMLGEKDSIHIQLWPQYEEKYLEEEKVMVVVQVNGRVRDQIVISKDILNDNKIVEEKAKESPKVKKFLGDLSANWRIKKVVYVPGKIINFVVDSE